MTRQASLLTGATGAAVISTSAVLIKLSELPATTAGALRTGYALPVLVLLALFERYRRGPRHGHHRVHSLLAGVLFGGCVVLQNLSIQFIGAGIATVVCNLQVLVVAVGGWWFFAEKPPRRLLLALPPALLGVVMVSGIVGGQAFGAQAALGVLAGLGNSLCYGAFLLVLRQAQIGGERHTIALMRDIAAVACAVALIAVVAAGDSGLSPSWPAHGWILLLALGPQVLGWLMITRAMPQLPVAVSGLLLLLQPIITMVLSMLALGEDPSAIQLAGCVLLLTAISCGAFGRSTEEPTVGAKPATEVGGTAPLVHREDSSTAESQPSDAATTPHQDGATRSSTSP